MRTFLLATIAAVSCAFAPNPVQRRGDVTLSAELDRRVALANGAAMAAGIFFASGPASALNNIPADNEIVKEQRAVTDKLDINNAPVADYMILPGMYPSIGGKIASNGMYTVHH